MNPNFLNDKIEFQHMRPMFDSDYVDALKTLGKLKKEKVQENKNKLETKFSFLMGKIRAKCQTTN